MAVNLDYLDPNLHPLEEAVKAYLAAEEDLRKLQVEQRNEPLLDAEQAQAAAAFEQRPPTGSYDQDEDEQAQQEADLRDDLRRLHQQVLDLLPVRDEWVKVNLGYGPSRVGAFRVPAAGDEQFEVRVVQ
ncbi:hypothetical protein [uncultured Hymenobacter sp.]|uniref:hypothetical protein n=1 Tax=uncultured Hymenobacter sp. TaxID=170016 RepID=UPI0035CC076D